MQSNTSKAVEVISDAAGLCVHTRVHQGGFELEATDYDVSGSGQIRFDSGTGDEDMIAKITISGETSDVSFWVTKEDAITLSDVFSDLAEDIERRE